MSDPEAGWWTVPSAAVTLTPVAAPVRTARSRVVRAMLGIVVVLFIVACGLLTILAIGSSTGLTGLTAGFVFALVPVCIVVPALLWLDRFEAEPTSSLVFAFAWGALVATFLALLVNSYSLVLLTQNGGDPTVTSVFIAPWVEETCKGSAVLLVLLWRRREFDGVVDGIVYAGLAGVGFAFTENVLYFGRSLQETGTTGLAVTFVLRGIFSPFAHPLFTMCTGIGLGVAVTTRRAVVRVAAPLLGWLCAVTLHGLWNLSAVAGLRGFLGLYILVQVPIFLAAVGFAIWARRREARLVTRHLQVYADSGWFTPAEVAMLGSMSERRRARAWAQAVGGSAGRRAMGAFQTSATELAFLRDRQLRAAVPDDGRAAERGLLRQVTAQRYGFVGVR